MSDARLSNVARLFVKGSDRPALVDLEFAELARYKWKIGLKGWVVREADRVIKLHRVVTGAAPGVGVVHRNGDKLDNRRENLQVQTEECDDA